MEKIQQMVEQAIARYGRMEKMILCISSKVFSERPFISIIVIFERYELEQR